MFIPVAPCGVWTAKLPGADELGASTLCCFHIYGRIKASALRLKMAILVIQGQCCFTSTKKKIKKIKGQVQG